MKRHIFTHVPRLFYEFPYVVFISSCSFVYMFVRNSMTSNEFYVSVCVFVFEYILFPFQDFLEWSGRPGTLGGEMKKKLRESLQESSWTFQYLHVFLCICTGVLNSSRHFHVFLCISMHVYVSFCMFLCISMYFHIFSYISMYFLIPMPVWSGLGGRRPQGGNENETRENLQEF